MEPHGLTRGEMKEFVAGKQCEICSSTENLVVDHCHAELKIRGVLCRKCNAVLGLMGDNPARLRAAAAYLER